MKSHGKSTILLCFGLFILVSFVFKTTECISVSSREFPSEKKENVFVSVAKSLASQALSEFQETARRNPRLGLNITMLLPAALTNLTGNSSSLPGAGLNPFLATSGQLGLIGLKGGILGLKAAVVQTAVAILFIIFLLAGIAYFACNIGIISCSNLGGSLGNLGASGGGGSGNTYSRNGYDYQNLHRSTSSVYNAIDDVPKKYT